MCNCIYLFSLIYCDNKSALLELNLKDLVPMQEHVCFSAYKVRWGGSLGRLVPSTEILQLFTAPFF